MDEKNGRGISSQSRIVIPASLLMVVGPLVTGVGYGSDAAAGRGAVLSVDGCQHVHCAGDEPEQSAGAGGAVPPDAAARGKRDCE
jgi:hypothetical protein